MQPREEEKREATRPELEFLHVEARRPLRVTESLREAFRKLQRTGDDPKYARQALGKTLDLFWRLHADLQALEIEVEAWIEEWMQCADDPGELTRTERRNVRSWQDGA